MEYVLVDVHGKAQTGCALGGQQTQSDMLDHDEICHRRYRNSSRDIFKLIKFWSGGLRCRTIPAVEKRQRDAAKETGENRGRKVVCKEYYQYILVKPQQAMHTYQPKMVCFKFGPN